MSIISRLMQDDSLCQRLDYGYAESAAEARPMQLMQLGAWLERQGIDMDDAAEGTDAMDELRAALMNGELDAWIYG